MERKIVTTGDGTGTLLVSELGESYHSLHGALQEARHVFVENGLKKIQKDEINILELGLGTGLNVMVSLDEFILNLQGKKINYHALELFPITLEEAKALSYQNFFENDQVKRSYFQLHTSRWEETEKLFPNFYFSKFNLDFHRLDEINLPGIDLVYFDCFGAKYQPDLWEKPLLKKVRKKMNDEALLTTYSSRGSFRRNLEALAFEVKKVPGPKGKREMINALKV